MIYIKKGAPHRNVSMKIAEIRRNPNWKKIPALRPTDPEEAKGYGDTLRSYFDTLPKREIRTTLLEEQHYLCAYCMRVLPGEDSVKIEHWFPLSEARDTAIDYQNFLASCYGVYSEAQQPCSCCDKQKSGTRITIDPREQWMMDCIQYESDGTLYFDAPDWLDPKEKAAIDYDIDVTLSLNGPESELRIYREKVLGICKKKMKDLFFQKKNMVVSVSKLLKELEEKPQYPAYAGVMLFYYKQWLKKHK